MPPIYQQSTVIFDNLAEIKKTEYSYGRKGTFTNRALEQKVSELENASQTMITSSGADAIFLSLLALTEPGNHILVCNTVYAPTRHFCDGYLKKVGVEVEYYDAQAGKEIKNQLKSNTKLIFMESPSSIFYEVQDVQAIVDLAKSRGIYTVLDNTYASSVLFKPLDWGVDVSVLSASKYYSGHSDLIMGVVASSDTKINRKIKNTYNLFGYHSSPFDCYLALRGLETIGVRMEKTNSSAQKIANWLAEQKEIDEVLYPTMNSFKQRTRFNKYFKQANGLFSFTFKKSYPENKVHNFVDALKHFGIGFSWGGVESLVMAYDKSTVRPINFDKNQTVIRMSIGLEKTKVLMSDIQKALTQLQS